jgi:hypothetical protein
VKHSLQSGGFGLLALALAHVPARDARQIPIPSWFEFRRAVEETRTLFVFVSQESHTGKSSASALELSQSGVEVECNPPQY